MTIESVELDLFNEVSPQKVNFYTVNAGRGATANTVIFFVGAWRMSQLKPWAIKPFEVETGEVDSWNDWKQYLTSISSFSASNIDDMVERINYMVSIETAKPDILAAIASFPMAIDDLRDGPPTTMHPAELISELAQLPNGAEARKRVAKEQGVSWYKSTAVTQPSRDTMEVDISEMDGDAEVDTFVVQVNTKDLPDELVNWLKSKFKVRRRREENN